MIAHLRTLLLLTALTLAGCHADITYRLNIHPDNTVTVSIKEKLDDQFFTMASGQQHSAFDFSKAQQNGWDVTKTVDDDDNHVFVIQKTVQLDELPGTLTENNTSKFSGQIPLDPTAMQTMSGLFTDKRNLSIVVPALMPKDPKSSDPYAGAASAMAASVLGVHLELKTPGTILSTNGETTSDGFTRWTLGLAEPTKIEYAVQTLDLNHIVLAVIVTTMVLVAIAVGLRRRSRRPQPQP